MRCIRCVSIHTQPMRRVLPVAPRVLRARADEHPQQRGGRVLGSVSQTAMCACPRRILISSLASFVHGYTSTSVEYARSVLSCDALPHAAQDGQQTAARGALVSPPQARAAERPRGVGGQHRPQRLAGRALGRVPWYRAYSPRGHPHAQTYGCCGVPPMYTSDGQFAIYILRACRCILPPKARPSCCTASSRWAWTSTFPPVGTAGPLGNGIYRLNF